MSSSNVSSVVNHFPTANEGFITTLSSTISSGAVTVGLTSTSGLTNGAIFVGIIEPGTVGKEQTFTGTVDTGGNQITGVKWTRGSNTGHNAGVTIVDYVTGTAINIITKGLLVEHKQSGAHAAITADSVASAGAVSGTTGTFSSTVAGVDGNFSGDIQHRSVSLETIRSELEKNFIASGCVWTGDSIGSTRVASMTSGVGYIAGKRFTISAVTSRTFTASKDTYVDVDNTGTLTYTEVTNNAASPALAAGSLRLGIVVTGASNIATVDSINQGNKLAGAFTAILPKFSTNTSYSLAVTDSLGNMICPRTPKPVIVGGTIRNVAATSGNPGGTHVVLNAMSAGVPFMCEPNTNYELVYSEPVASGTTTQDGLTLELCLSSTSGASTNPITEVSVYKASATSHGWSVTIPFSSGTLSGLQFANIWWRTGGTFTGTMTFNTDNSRTGVATVKKVS